MSEKTIICIECGNPFTLTVPQQERIIALGFDEPKRCRDCREKKSKGGLSRYEEKMRHKNRHPKNERDRLYNLRKVRNALIVADVRKERRRSRKEGSLDR